MNGKNTENGKKDTSNIRAAIAGLKKTGNVEKAPKVKGEKAPRVKKVKEPKPIIGTLDYTIQIHSDIVDIEKRGTWAGVIVDNDTKVETPFSTRKEMRRLLKAVSKEAQLTKGN